MSSKGAQRLTWSRDQASRRLTIGIRAMSKKNSNPKAERCQEAAIFAGLQELMQCPTIPEEFKHAVRKFSSDLLLRNVAYDDSSSNSESTRTETDNEQE